MDEALSIGKTISPAMQWGFAGFAMILLGILVWVLSRHWAIYTKTMEVISHNSTVIEKASAQQAESLGLLKDIHTMLLSRRCVARDSETED